MGKKNVWMVAYQSRLRNHLLGRSLSLQTLSTPHPDWARAAYADQRGVSQAASFAKALSHFLANVLTGIMDLSGTLALSSCPCVPS